MQDENSKSLSALRFDRATECLSEAKMLLDSQMYKGSANRSYYAVFHAMRSVLALDGIDRAKHTGVIEEFRKRYIKEHIFDVKMSYIISLLFDTRNASDYNDFYIIVKEDVIKMYNDAVYFLDEVKKYLDALDTQ